MTPLICAGDGPLRSVLERLAQDVSGIELAGWLSQADLAKRMNTARALIVPGLVAPNGDAEGLPSVVLEAMARGCAVIGTDEGGIAEAVSNETNGLLVRPRDADALAIAMHRLHAETGLAERLGWQGFQIARERFTATRQSEALEKILLEAANSR